MANAALTNATAGVGNASNTGLSWFLLGYRSRCEDSPANTTEFIRVSRTVAVPAGDAAGSFVYQFRYQAFDSLASTTTYDWMTLDVGGTLVNHTTLGIPNPGANLNIQTYGVGRNPTYGPAPVDAGWQHASLNLAPYAGTTITLRFTMRFYGGDDVHKSWVKLDDVEWSRQNGTITSSLALPALTSTWKETTLQAWFLLEQDLHSVGQEIFGRLGSVARLCPQTEAE